MKKTFLLLLIAFSTMAVHAQQQITKTFVWEGQERQYIEYIPSTYVAGDATPVMFCLHGLNSTAASSFETLNPTALAEKSGWIFVFPQALDWTAQLPLGMGSYPCGPTWNAGITVSGTITVYGMPFNFDLPVNPDVNDAGFLMAALDSVETDYSVNADSVFFAGFSLGGFMSHRMAIEHGDIINGIASVSGIVGNNMSSLTPVANVNVLQIHGTADEVITYDAGTVSYQGYGPFVVGLGAEASVDYWRNFNNCSPDAIIEQYPDLVNDGLTFEMHTYLGGDNDTRVALLKVNNGAHEWYSGSGHDIDYLTEIYRFFTNTLDVTGIGENEIGNSVAVFPNPACDVINLPLSQPTEVRLYDVTGSEVSHGVSTGTVDVSDLSSGVYFVRILGDKPCSATFVVSR